MTSPKMVAEEALQTLRRSWEDRQLTWDSNLEPRLREVLEKLAELHARSLLGEDDEELEAIVKARLAALGSQAAMAGVGAVIDAARTALLGVVRVFFLGLTL